MVASAEAAVSEVGRWRLRLSYLPVYTCAQCGRKAVGATVTIECEGFSTTALDSAVRETSQRPPSAMPVGWASFYAPAGTEFRCVTCLSKEK